MSAATEFMGVTRIGSRKAANAVAFDDLSSTFRETNQQQGESEALSHLNLDPYAQSLRARALDKLAQGHSGKALDMMLRALETLGRLDPQIAQDLFHILRNDLEERGFEDLANILGHNFTPQEHEPASPAQTRDLNAA